MKPVTSVIGQTFASVVMVGLLGACQVPVGNADGQTVAASGLQGSPQPGPPLFGPLDEEPSVQPRGQNGNRARAPRTTAYTGRDQTSVAPTIAEPAFVPTPAPAPVPVAAPDPAPAATPTPAPTPAPTVASAAEAAGTDGYTTTAAGRMYLDTVGGQGELPQTGDTIMAHYTGWLYENGRKGDMFDRSRGQPLSFILGSGQVIRGWDEAFTTMRPGGERTLIIPPNLAYGRSGAAGLIPPNATLMFDVELVEIRSPR